MSGEASQLHDAVERGDLAAARELLTQHPKIVDQARGEVRAIHMALLRRDLPMTKLLLEFGTDTDAGIWPNRDATNPYAMARERAYDEIFDVIREAREKRRAQVPKSSPDTTRIEDKSPLEAAVKENRPDVLRKLLDMGLDPDERRPISFNATYDDWTQGGPLYEAVIANRGEMARMLLARGANPNASVWCAGSATYKAYEANNAEMIALLTEHGGWVDAGSAGYARQTEIARKMLAGEIDPHLEPTDFSGKTVAEQLLWGGASSMTPEIVRMALEQVDWAADDTRWFGMLWRPLTGSDDPRVTEAIECFRLILSRCGPHHRGDTYKQTILHEVMSQNADSRIAEMLLNAGARLDVRDVLLNSTPLGWACRWGRTKMAKLLLDRGAEPIEPDAEPWATPRAWAEKMHRLEIVALLPPAS